MKQAFIEIGQKCGAEYGITNEMFDKFLKGEITEYDDHMKVTDFKKNCVLK